MRRCRICRAHPAVVFLCFAGAAGLTLTTMHPVLLLLSYLCGAVSLILLDGARAWLRRLPVHLLLVLALGVTNGLVNGLGLTVLFAFFGTPVTWEAVLYGLCSGVMLAAVIQWFSCFQSALGGDQFITLFGRIAPVTSMMVAMVFRYIPELLRKGQEIRTAQQALLGGPKGRRGSLAQGIRMASILMSWSLEGSIETAQSMRARGYGANTRRTLYAPGIARADLAPLACLGVLLAAGVGLRAAGQGTYEFFPWVDALAPPPGLTALYGLFMLAPVWMEGREYLAWLKSRL